MPALAHEPLPADWQVALQQRCLLRQGYLPAQIQTQRAFPSLARTIGTSRAGRDGDIASAIGETQAPLGARRREGDRIAHDRAAARR
jgi:hypothetical protein